MEEVKKQSVPATQTTANKAVQKAQNISFSSFIKSDKIQNALTGTLGDAMHAKTFTASLISAVNTNRDLAQCDGMSIVSGALLGESLKLSPSPQLGQYYLVPFRDNKSGITKATFQLGWKGYYQLALRSGQYKNIDAVAIKEGELKDYNPITGEIELEPIKDPLERENANTVGYYAFFELSNGFKKAMYWSKEKMKAHALKYSAGYKSDVEKGYKYTFWSKDFDGMALKTMYRQLISKYGIMSVDMQQAFTNDMTIQNDINQAESEPIYFDADTGEVINE